MQGTPVECEDSYTVIVMNLIDCKEHKDYEIGAVKRYLINAFYFKNTFCKCSFCNAIQATAQ